MFKKLKPDDAVKSFLDRAPHCDARVLHAPGECGYCDTRPIWQALRLLWGIAFTGYEPEERELPCPATMHRDLAVINKWHGNVPVPEKEQSGD